jgi:ubiquinone/menaquinone biosynthesis C-methylase UbiE
MPLNLKHIEKIRLAEMKFVLVVLKKFKPGKGIMLEIGAGAGWQAQKFSETGYDIKAIDTEYSNYSQHRVWPVLNYDGVHIPFPDDYFDIVYSSSVLEHIPHLKEFQFEIKRVLKPDGIVIHVVPSAAWRAWTNAAHYLGVLKTVIVIVRNKVMPKTANQIGSNVETVRPPLTKLVTKAIFPPRHGEKGNSISEIYHFSRWGWSAIFKTGGWKIKERFSGRLFYTGCMIFASALPVPARKYLSYFLGSSCHIFLLKR